MMRKLPNSLYLGHAYIVCSTVVTFDWFCLTRSRWLHLPHLHFFYIFACFVNLTSSSYKKLLRCLPQTQFYCIHKTNVKKWGIVTEQCMVYLSLSGVSEKKVIIVFNRIGTNKVHIPSPIYRWTWIWRTTVRRIFAYDGLYAWSQSNAYQIFVICIRRILHMSDQFSWSHWVCHIQVLLYISCVYILCLVRILLHSS